MPTTQIKLREKLNKSYPIFIEHDKPEKVSEFLKRQKLGQRYAIITDSKVKKLYAQAFSRFLKKNGIESEVFAFIQGEKNKTLQNIEKISNEMIQKGFTRKDAIIAMGGGVAGDLGGFLASIYMRGIPFIQIPTTLLAMVDASVGGKTGVDLESGKNLLGTITQPKAVFIDTKYLKTLSQNQFKNGLAEVVKTGVIANAALFKFLEKNLEKVLEQDQRTLEQVIDASVKVKAKVVEKDEKESGLRMILNYGHTYGHAIEKLSNYTLLHGYAISIGMVIENKIAVDEKILKEKDSDRIKNLLKRIGLPISIIKKPATKDLLSDKKRDQKHIHMVLPIKIGKTTFYKLKCK